MSLIDSISSHGSISSQPSKSNPTIQFFVRLFSEMETLVIRADVNDTIEHVLDLIQAKSGIPLNGQPLIYKSKQLYPEQTLGQCCVENDAVLQLVGVMPSTRHVKAQQTADEIVSLIWRLCKRKPGNKSLDSEARYLIRRNLTDYFTDLLPSDNDMAIGHLQLVGVMPSTRHVKAQQTADEIVSLIWRLCKRKPGNKSLDSEARYLIRRNLTDYFTDLLPSDNDMAIGHLQVFSYSGVPAALVMLYMSPDHMMFGDELLRELVWVISFMPPYSFQQCVPILMEICKLLRRMPYYADNVIFDTCRTCLSSMVEFIEIEAAILDGGGCSTNFVTLKDMLTFVQEAVDKIILTMDGGIQPYTSMSPSLSLMTEELLHFKSFLMPLKRFIHGGYCYTKASQGEPYILTYTEDFNFMLKIFLRLLKKIDDCLEQLEKLLPSESENLGCNQYVLILIELNNMSKHFPVLARQFWKTLGRRKLSFCYLIIKYATRGEDYRWILEHKDVIDSECRRHLAMMLLPQVSDEDDDYLEILIERSRLLEDSFEYIAHAEADTLQAGLTLEFKDEEATGPGVLREWFVLVCEAIFDPQTALFVACPNDGRRFFPNPASKVDPLHLEYFKFAGRVIALALMYNVQVGIAFDRVLLLQLAGRNVSLEDTRDADPILYSSCKRILEMDPEEVDEDSLSLTFTVETNKLGCRNAVELYPDGKNIVVNSTNRDKYVARLVQYHFVDSVKDQVAQFAQGFDDIISSGRLRKSFFQFLELEDFDRLLYGSEKAISVEDWKSHTDYDGYEETDPQIWWFWETVASMSAGQRKALLFFWTSLKNLPVEGFGGLTCRLYIYKVSESCNRLPTSQTCFYRLCFPPYQSLKVMQDRLSLITQDHVGCSFGTF
nr:PREDICTED: E3 ubiquitin-protein ligase UPL5-like [Daucus carota subsp. sativus]